MEHPFSYFMLVNLDCPMEGRENMFVYISGSGVPYLWHDVSMSMLAGDFWILSSYVIHRGGAVPRDARLNVQIIHLQESCTFRVKNETKKFQCKLTRDG